MQVDTLYAVQAGDLALLRGQWCLSGTGSDEKPIEMKGNNVEVARRQSSGEWLFVVDHPFGADEGLPCPVLHGRAQDAAAALRSAPLTL